MATQSEHPNTSSGPPVGDHRRLHDLLAELRHRAGDPSLRKINSGCGVSVGYLSQIFTGKTAPGPDVAVRVAQALKASEREQARVRFYAEGTEADRTVQRTADTGRSRRPGWDGCPYLGLRPFEEQHAAIFYGRRALTGRLLDRLREHPPGAGLLLVLGPSGAGKSSLLRAGLMGALAGDGLAPGSQFWPRRVITPTGDPVRQLAIHLADLAATDAISVQEALTARPEQAYLLAGQALAAAGGCGPRLVLVVDQLEELFTLTTDPAEQETFLAVLHSLATGPVLPDGRPGALIIAGIRGDFLDQALAFAPVRHATEAGAFTVGTMSESELREAVTGPAAEAGVRIPDDLCAAILDDLRERSLPAGFDSGALPLLSQVMFVMWQARESAGLTVAGYHRTGGVADIVRTSAEQVYDTLTPGQQDLARRVFTHLTATTDGRLTRRPGTRSALRAAVGSDDTDTVIEAFAAQRLLTVADNDTVTIAHEELLRSWNRLRDWLQPDLTDQALHQALTDDVHDWQQRDRDSSYLYQGGRLLAVDDALRRWTDDPAQHFTLDPATTEFLDASRHRARRRRRAYQGVAAVMVLLLIVAGISAVVANRNAARAERQHTLALSRQLAALSRTASATDRTTSEQLAAAALHVAGTDEAFAAASALLGDSRGTLPGDPKGRIVFSRGGKLLATAGADKTVRLWDPATQRPIGEPLTGHTEAVSAVVFSPDGNLLATADAGGVVRLWDPATRRSVGEPLTGHTGVVWAMVFSPDGKLLATGGSDQTVRLWDPVTRRPVGTPLIGHTDAVFSVVFSPDGRLLATAGLDDAVRLWNPGTRRLVGAPLTGHTGAVSAVVFSPDGRLLATAGLDKTVRLWNPATQRPVGEPMTGHTGAVSAVAFSPDGKLLATAGGLDKTIRLWDPATRRPVGEPMTGHTKNVSAVLFSPDGRLLASAGFDSAVRLWDPATRQPVGAPVTGHSESLLGVFSADGRVLATGDADGVVRLWDPATGRPIGEPMTGHTEGVSAVAFSPDGKLLATAGYATASVRLLDPATGRPVGEPLTGHSEGVSAVAFSPDGRLLATGDDGGVVRLWDPVTRRPIGEPLTGHAGGVSAVVFSPDGKLLATAGDGGGAVRLWDPATGRPVGEPLTGHSEGVSAVVFSPDGRLLATGDSGGVVRLWDPATGRPVGEPLTGHTGGVSAIVFSPDGKLLATTGLDGVMRLRDAATGRLTGAPLPGEEQGVWAAEFSPDGKLLATGDQAGTVRLWDLDAGRPTGAPLTGHTETVLGLAFSPDGALLATAGFDKTLRFWDLSAFRNPLAYLCDRAGGLTESDWRTYAADEPFREVCGN